MKDDDVTRTSVQKSVVLILRKVNNSFCILVSYLKIFYYSSILLLEHMENVCELYYMIIILKTCLQYILLDDIQPSAVFCTFRIYLYFSSHYLVLYYRS